MADNGRWFKLWITAPYDPHLSNLSLEDFARWCLFGIYLKTHGNNGVIEITSPAIAIQQLFRVQSYDEIMHIINCFPSCQIIVTSVTTATVTWCNWLKYQGDFSGDRVRKFRDVKRTKKRGEERRREEKRKEENNTPIVPLKRERHVNGFPEQARGILSFLNEKANRNYQPVKANIDFIVCRLKEGASIKQCRQVIAKKTREWLPDEKMNQFLRPATLFNKTKFAQYVGELVRIPEGDDNELS